MDYNLFKFHLEKNQKLYISPCSTLTKKLKQDLELKGIKVSGFVDKHNKESIKPSQIKNLEIDSILILSPKYDLEIAYNLSKYIIVKKLISITKKDMYYFKKNIFLQILFYHIYKYLSVLIKFIFKSLNIKFSILCSARIGEFVLRSEKFIRANRDKNKKYLLLCSRDKKDIANITVCNLYKKRFAKETDTFFIQNSFLAKLLNQPFYDDFTLNLQQTSNEFLLYIDKQPSISFDKKEVEYGKDMLEKLNIATPYVCIFARDSNYLKTNFHHDDYSHHDYRDCDIKTYNKAIEYLIQKGFTVVRMGSSALKPSSFKHENFLDYSFSEIKNDFMDIFLISECTFMLGNTSGLVDVCNAFSVPRVGVNHMPIDHAPYATSKDIFIPKKLLFNGKYLGLYEYLNMMEYSNLNHWDANSYRQLNITIEDNSENEILSIVKEYLGDYSYNKGDKQNQETYQKIHLHSKQFKQVPTRIGADFLKNNKWFIQSKNR